MAAIRSLGEPVAFRSGIQNTLRIVLTTVMILCGPGAMVSPLIGLQRNGIKQEACHITEWHCSTVYAQTELSDLSTAGLPPTPSGLQSLWQRSQPELIFYELRPPGLKYDGETRFDIHVDYRFQLRTKRIGNRLVATILFTRIDVQMTQQITLPEYLKGKDFWDSQLVLHELDHVRINADPRIKLLMNKLVSNIKRLETAASNQDAEFWRREVDARVQQAMRDVTNLVQANNDLLDKVTQHGRSAEIQDVNFFNRLFTEENLRDMQFAPLPELSSLLKSRSYRKFSKQANP